MSQKEKRAKGLKTIFEEIIAEKFPNMRKGRFNQVQEEHRDPSRIIH